MTEYTTISRDSAIRMRTDAHVVLELLKGYVEFNDNALKALDEMAGHVMCLTNKLPIENNRR